ncbi:MAG: hypothetical protein M1821_002094 [Bathelium mastoideum]|nr:MAG: hypothetical protein M1821_002094 [Bathelium mastoideum]
MDHLKYLQVTYTIRFDGGSHAIGGLLEDYAVYLRTQPIVKGNSRAFEIDIRHAVPTEIAPQIMQHQHWSTREAMVLGNTAPCGEVATEEAPSIECGPEYFGKEPVAGFSTLRLSRIKHKTSPHTSRDSKKERASQSSSETRKTAVDDDSATSKSRRKFRTEREVMNRIRHDPKLNIDEYLVGYKDRFLGIMEMHLDGWKADITEEEFIPLHRIVHFKKKDTQEIVWDRHHRIDLIWR